MEQVMDAEVHVEGAAECIDPIGAPVLPKISRHTVRALALTGVALGSPLAAGILAQGVTQTWPPGGN
jgi:hypothetical protein